jgi:hypothetical protein
MAIYVFDKSGVRRLIRRFYELDSGGAAHEIREQDYLQAAFARFRRKRMMSQWIAILVGIGVLARIVVLCIAF